MEIETRRSRDGKLAGVALLAALFLAGCATASPQGSGFGDAPSAAEQGTVLQVENNNWQDMRIYAVLGGTRTRLGSVTSQSRSSFELPRSVNLDANTLRLVAVPVGNRQDQHLSPRMSVNPGDEVVWRLENQITLSSLHLR